LSHSFERPVGITIIAILALIAGIVLVFGGLSSLVSGAFFATISTEVVTTQLELQQQTRQETQNVVELRSLIQLLGNISISLGAIVLAIGIGYLVVSYGLLKGRRGGWTIAVILTIVSIVIQIAFVISTNMLNTSLNHDMNTSLYHLVDQIIGIAINGVILYYLYRPKVKEYFGKSQPSTTIQR
jgi:hypothetical protein